MLLVHPPRTGRKTANEKDEVRGRKKTHQPAINRWGSEEIHVTKKVTHHVKGKRLRYLLTNRKRKKFLLTQLKLEETEDKKTYLLAKSVYLHDCRPFEDMFFHGAEKAD